MIRGPAAPGIRSGSMIEPSNIKSRIVLAGYEYWLARRDAMGVKAPGRGDLDPLTEIPRLVPYMMLKDVRRDPLDFRYRLIGTQLRVHMSQDWTGKWLSEIPFQNDGSAVWENNRWVMENIAPLHAQPPYIGPHRDFLHVDSVILPLASDHHRVDMLMFFVDFIRREKPAGNTGHSSQISGPTQA